MTCPQCGAVAVPTDARYCPACGASLTTPKDPVARVNVSQDVGQTGQVIGLQVETVSGGLTVERIDQSVTTLIEGDALARFFERDRSRESLRDLAREIDGSVIRFMMAIQFAEVGSANLSQQQYDQAYVDWEIKREDIETALRAQRLGADIVTRWDAFATTVSEVYALSGTYLPSIRLPRLRTIEAALAQADVDWPGLKDIEARRGQGKDWERYTRAWWAMRQALMAQKDALVDDILNAPTDDP